MGFLIDKILTSQNVQVSQPGISDWLLGGELAGSDINGNIVPSEQFLAAAQEKMTRTCFGELAGNN